MKKNLFIRVDGSAEIGTGHIIRCIALANELKNLFNKIIFLTNNTSENLIDIIKDNDFQVKILDENGLNNEIKSLSSFIALYDTELNYLLIDHYDIDHKYEYRMRKFFKKIFIIDDLANRKHDCDLLIDQNYYKNLNSRYDELVPTNCIVLLGPKYVILRSEFQDIQKIKLKKNTSPKNILISYGGSDPKNESEKILDAIKTINNTKFFITLVTGIHNQNFEQLQRKTFQMKNIKIFKHVQNFSQLLSNSDLCFGAGGTTTWERFFVGVPSIVTIVSSDQKESVEFLSHLGHVINLGFAQDMTVDKYTESLLNLDPEILYKISLNNQKLVDGQGKIRIKKQIIQLIDE